MHLEDDFFKYRLGSEENDSREKQFHCRKLSHDERLEKYCTIINDALEKLEHAFKTVLEGS